MMQTPTPQSILLARRKGHRLIVPSGVELRVRYLSPAQFMTRGDIPNLLLPIVVQFQKEGGERLLESIAKQMEDDAEKAMKDMRDYMALTNLVLSKFIVYPNIVETPGEDNPDEMSLDELDETDKGWLMSLIGLPARQLETFCALQTESMERVLRGEDSPDTPLSASESESPLSGIDGDTGTG